MSILAPFIPLHRQFYFFDLSANVILTRSCLQGFTHALYNLAANPQYTQPLREEIESVLKSEGWTKAAMTKMVKLDSFFKESSRIMPLVAGK